MAGPDGDLAHGQILVLRADVLQQGLAGLLLGGVPTGIDVAHAPPRRQADVPGPAGVVCGGDGVRGHGRIGCVERHLHGERRVAEQDVGAGLEGHTERLADEQSRETAAVDEQIAGNGPGLPRDDTFDVTGLALFDFR